MFLLQDIGLRIRRQPGFQYTKTYSLMYVYVIIQTDTHLGIICMNMAMSWK